MKRRISTRVPKGRSKASAPQALRLLRTGQTDKAWLLSHSAIVAGLVGLASVGSPSVAMAAGGCTPSVTSGYYNCHGNTIVDPDGVNVGSYHDGNQYDITLYGTGEDPYKVNTSNVLPAFLLTESEDGDGYVHIQDGSIVNNSIGDGFEVRVDGGYVTMDIDGDISGGSEDGIGLYFNANSADADITVGDTGSIFGGYSDAVYSRTSGSFSLTNTGTIHGSYYGTGVYVEGASDVTIANHSYKSIIGYQNGVQIVDTGDYVAVDNRRGLIGCIGSNGLVIYDVAGYTEDVTVGVDNTDSGIIVGDEDGIYIGPYVGPSSSPETETIRIDNGTTLGVADGQSGREVRQLGGGLIYGATGSGIEIDGWDYLAEEDEIFGDIVITNSGTLNSWLGTPKSGEDFEDEVMSTYSEDAWSLLGNLGYEASTFVGLKLPGGADGYAIPRGIIGSDAGIDIEDVSSNVFVYNNGYYIPAGTIYDGVSEDMINYDRQWVSGGQIIGTDGDGVYMSYVDGHVQINNSNNIWSWNEGDTYQRGGAIVGMDGSGINLSYIEDGVHVLNQGGTSYGDDNGILVNYVSEYYDSDADWYLSVRVQNQGGDIWGNTADGINVAYVNGDVWVQNDGGTTYGHDDGINISNTYYADVYVDNSKGFIQGFYGDGIDLNVPSTWDSEEQTYYGGNAVVHNGNWQYDPETDREYLVDGGVIWGADSAIRIDSEWASIYNGSRGVIIGDGGSEDQAVIELATWSHEYDDDTTFTNYINNVGLITSDSLIWRSWHAPDGGEIDQPLAENALRDQLDSPFTEAELDGIDNAVHDLFNYAWSSAAMGRLTNGSEDAYSLSDFRSAASDMAVHADNIEISGATYVDNSGLLIGRVALFGEDFGYVGEEGVSIGNTIDNYGAWFTSGTSYFGYGNDAVFNTGLVQTAFASDATEYTTFDGLYRFYNGYYFDSSSSLEGQTDARAGLLSMVDGGTGDEIYTAYDFIGTQVGEDVRSFVASDVDFHQASADMLFVGSEDGGTVYGNSGVIFNVVGRGTTGADQTIGVALADYHAEDGGSGFFIDDNSAGYVLVDGVASLQDGFYAWYMRERSVEDGDLFELVSTWAPQTAQAPQIMTALQGAWYDTADNVADHVYGGHFARGQAGGGGADMAVGEIPMDTGGQMGGVWAKVSGSLTDRQADVLQDIPPGPPVTIDTSLSQKTYAVLGGVDFTPVDSGDGSFRAGLFGGYVQSTATFDMYGATADMEGGTIGVYGAYTSGGFYADAELKTDVIDVTYNLPFAPGFDVNGKSTSIGVLANTGYRMQTGDLYFEPLASLAYVHTEMEDLTAGTATVSFSNGESLRAGVGARVGATFGQPGEVNTEISLLAKVWNEFEDANVVTVSDGTNSATFTDDISGLFGEVRATGTMFSSASGLSAFASAGVKFNEDFTTVDGKLGVRVGF